MTNTEFSNSYFNSARQVIKEAEGHFADQSWHLVVRRCQECVELCLKGMLRGAGLEVPRLHDVGFLFRQETKRFPGMPVDRIVSISRRLRSEREISYYGDDLTETPPDQLYTEKDAVEALDDARFIMTLIPSE